MFVCSSFVTIIVSNRHRHPTDALRRSERRLSVHTHAHTHTHTRTHARAHAHAHVHTHAHACARTRARTRMRHAHTRTRAHAHASSFSIWRSFACLLILCYFLVDFPFLAVTFLSCSVHCLLFYLLLLNILQLFPWWFCMCLFVRLSSQSSSAIAVVIQLTHFNELNGDSQCTHAHAPCAHRVRARRVRTRIAHVHAARVLRACTPHVRTHAHNRHYHASSLLYVNCILFDDRCQLLCYSCCYSAATHFHPICPVGSKYGSSPHF